MYNYIDIIGTQVNTFYFLPYEIRDIISKYTLQNILYTNILIYNNEIDITIWNRYNNYLLSLHPELKNLLHHLGKFHIYNNKLYYSTYCYISIDNYFLINETLLVDNSILRECLNDFINKYNNTHQYAKLKYKYKCNHIYKIKNKSQCTNNICFTFFNKLEYTIAYCQFHIPDYWRK